MSLHSVGSQPYLYLSPAVDNPKISYSSKELIDSLSVNPAIHEAYCKPAGVWEGYTVAEHTGMVLDVFNKELINRPHTKSVLDALGISSEDFSLFLALHDIGKGYAAEKRCRSMKEKKNVELSKTREIVHDHAKVLKLERLLNLFDALLSDDIIGDFMKGVCPYRDVITLNKKLQEFSDKYKIPSGPLLEGFILFHQCDASSYPLLRNSFFSIDSGQTVKIGKETLRSLKGEGDEIYCEQSQEKLKAFRLEFEEFASNDH